MTHMSTYTHTNTRTCTYVYTYKHTNTRTCTYVYTYKHTYVHVCIHIQTHKHTYVHVCIHTQTHTHARTHTHLVDVISFSSGGDTEALPVWWLHLQVADIPIHLPPGRSTASIAEHSLCRGEGDHISSITSASTDCMRAIKRASITEGVGGTDDIIICKYVCMYVCAWRVWFDVCSIYRSGYMYLWFVLQWLHIQFTYIMQTVKVHKCTMPKIKCQK